MAREPKIGDRVVDWTDESGVILSVCHPEATCPEFTMRYADGREETWGWAEFGSDGDPTFWQGSFRFEDTEYPEWPR